MSTVNWAYHSVVIMLSLSEILKWPHFTNFTEYGIMVYEQRYGEKFISFRNVLIVTIWKTFQRYCSSLSQCSPTYYHAIETLPWKFKCDVLNLFSIAFPYLNRLFILWFCCIWWIEARRMSSIRSSQRIPIPFPNKFRSIVQTLNQNSEYVGIIEISLFNDNLGWVCAKLCG